VEQGSPQIAMFDTFGFKVLAGTEELAATLQSRCIITSMSRAVRQVRLFVDEERAQELRDKLLMYRFKMLGRSLERLEFEGVLQNARVIELLISLLQVAPTQEIRQRLLACMKEIGQSQLEEEQAGIEARVFDSVQKCEDKVEDGKLATATVAEAFNEGLTEKEQVTNGFIGRKLRARALMNVLTWRSARDPFLLCLNYEILRTIQGSYMTCRLLLFWWSSLTLDLTEP